MGLYDRVLAFRAAAAPVPSPGAAPQRGTDRAPAPDTSATPAPEPSAPAAAPPDPQQVKQLIDRVAALDKAMAERRRLLAETAQGLERVQGRLAPLERLAQRLATPPEAPVDAHGATPPAVAQAG